MCCAKSFPLNTKPLPAPKWCRPRPRSGRRPISTDQLVPDWAAAFSGRSLSRTLIRGQRFFLPNASGTALLAGALSLRTSAGRLDLETLAGLKCDLTLRDRSGPPCGLKQTAEREEMQLELAEMVLILCLDD
jgi:hypothetical protein